MINVQVPELLIYDETQYVVDRLDEVIMMIPSFVIYDLLQISRKLFPFAFLVTSVAYW